MRGRAAAGRRRFEEMIAAAWHVEAFARTKRLPDLGKVLQRETAIDSDAAVIAMFDRLAARGLVTMD
ncbi:hypothetical protein [Sphingomonas sp.]|jgi:hypothetical protein|uniref:hypothetical protein n=1 Tax=Sphingomonas sp. TaxID=28214 RepID=UPI002D7FE3B9|nr:hypothetical protein [Sphingomonas sp.]HEU0045078.1 hypothetical protein [Sphingomonas sp.]